MEQVFYKGGGSRPFLFDKNKNLCYNGKNT